LQTTTADEKEGIVGTLARSLSADKFWGIRLEAATALGGVPGQAAKSALLAATKDSNARVRARVITSLAKSNDATLANVYQRFLDDPSYAVIRSAALALGQTRSGDAYDSLVKLTGTPSWRDTIRASALSGLTALGDKRGGEIAKKYAMSGNNGQVRAAAVKLLSTVAKDDPGAFDLISQILEEAYRNSEFGLSAASAEALATLGDARGLAVFERLTKDVTAPPQLAGVLGRFRDQLRNVSGGGQKATQH
jgi:HEAT repeat protein